MADPAPMFRDERPRPPRLRLLAASLAVLGPAALAAQPPASGAPRDSSPQRDSTAVVLSAVQVRSSIVPTAASTVRSGVPARITTVGREALRSWEPRLLPDALGAQAGVSIYDDLGSPAKLTLTTRGFSVGPTVGLPPGVSVFVDGVRQNEPDAQEVNFDLLPLAHVARIELLSGSASLLGANSLGGAVNLVTRRGEGPLAGTLELSTASFGGLGAEGTVHGSTAGGTDYYAGGSAGRERGWRDATGARRYDAFANVGRIGARRGATLQLSVAQSRAETAGSLPEDLFHTAARTNFTEGDFEALGTVQLVASGYVPTAAGRASATVYVRGSSAERFNVNQAPDPDVRARTANRTVGGTIDWRRVVRGGPGTLALRAGADGAVNRVRARIFLESGGTAAPDGPDDDERLGLTTDVRSASSDIAGYALADYRVGRVTLSGGGRVDAVRIPFRNLVDEAGETTSHYRALSPRLGVTADVGRGASVYASLGGSFRAPAVLELGCAEPDAACPLPFALGDDPPLRPVRATTTEVGGRWVGGALIATASAYRAAVRDEIFFVASDLARLAGFFTNLPRTRREGVEVSVQGSAAHRRLAWYGNYAYTRATFRSAETLFSARADSAYAGSPLAGTNAVAVGRRLPLVPAHQLKGGATLVARSWIDVGIDARYTGRQWLRGDEANETRPLAGYAAVDARLGVSAGRWAVGLIATNVLDAHSAVFGTFNENHRSHALERFLTPLTGRGLRLTLRRSFGPGRTAGAD